MTRRNDRSMGRIARVVEGDEVRARRANSPWLDASLIGPGLALVNGRIQMDLEPHSFLYLTKRGKLDGRVDDPLFVGAASPYAIRARLPDVAAIRTNVAAVRAENARLAAENAALTVRVEAAEAAAVDLDARIALIEGALAL